MYSSKFFILTSLLSIFLMACGENPRENKTTTETQTVEGSVTQNSYDNYLAAADIEKVSGLTGVKLVPKDPTKGAGGNLNFATSDDKLIVMVQIVDKSFYEGYKEYFTCTELKGLGDQAMKGASIPNGPENLVVFTKGNTCVALTVFINMNDMSKNMLSVEQTAELAKIIEGRM